MCHDDVAWWCGMLTWHGDVAWWHSMLILHDDVAWWHGMMMWNDDMEWLLACIHFFLKWFLGHSCIYSWEIVKLLIFEVSGKITHILLIGDHRWAYLQEAFGDQKPSQWGGMIREDLKRPIFKNHHIATKTVPCRRSCQADSNGANGVSSGLQMQKILLFEVWPQ